MHRSAPPTTLLAILLVTTLTALAGCQPQGEPVGELTVEMGEGELPYPAWRTLRLSFRPTASLGAEDVQPLVFVHLLREKGRVLRTFDHRLPARWRAGEEVGYDITLYQSALAPPLEPGEYTLTVGLYNASGERWPLLVEGEDLGRFEYAVAKVQASPPGDSTPELLFSPEWSAVEEGTDLQVLARRWLSGEGTLTARGLEIPGTLWMKVRIPQPQGSASRLVVHDGEEPRVTIAAACSGSEFTLAGPGEHTVTLPVFSENGSGACEIRFASNFYLLRMDSLKRASLALEVLSWSAAELP